MDKTLQELHADHRGTRSSSTESSFWAPFRTQFELSTDLIQMGLMLVAPHPKTVRDAIELYRRKLDGNPVEYVKKHREVLDWEVAQAAARYLQANADEVALTSSTTMGLSLVYSGLKVRAGDDILTTTHGHYSSDKALEFAAQRNGASLRRVALYREPATVSVDEVLGNLNRAILPTTRVIAATYVHSCNGVKMPIHEMSALIKEVNRRRSEAERVWFLVDAVHAFGVESFTMEELGCDFMVAGTHKWLFGPRGTGIIWARSDAWRMVDPIVPQFNIAFDMWMNIHPERKLSFFEKMTAGGFQAFEHRWALKEAFELHLQIGKENIQTRTHQLSSISKEGLLNIPHIKLHTPLSSSLSSGVICFDVEGVGPRDVVRRLRDSGIIASIAPYRTICPRLSPCVLNTEEEVMRCIEVLENMRPSN